MVERNLSIPVPAGIKDGEILKINVDPSDSDAYRGTVDKQSIFIQFKVEASDYFKVDGFDLHSSADISLPQAIFGGKILIDGLWSEEEITIEPGTDSHQTIKLAHKGLKDNERSSYGDHYVHLKILIPKYKEFLDFCFDLKNIFVSTESYLLKKIDCLENMLVLKPTLSEPSIT